MKIIHVPYKFHPDPVGGTEIYVESLAREMLTRGAQIVVAAPGARNATYTHAGLNVRRFRGAEPVVGDLRALYGAGDPTYAMNLEQIVLEERPNLVHLHAMSQATSLHALRAIRRAGIPVVFTYHTPTVTCQRGTLLRWGTQLCDGVLDVRRCTGCTLHGLGLNSTVSRAVATVPPVAGRIVDRLGLKSGPWTAVRMPELMYARHTMLRSFFHEVDGVVVVCEWARQLLVQNGVPEGKIRLSRHGIAWSSDSAGLMPTEHAADQRLRVAFVGRLDPSKGVGILIQALRELPTLEAELHVYGSVHGPADEAFLRDLQSIANGDRRIQFHAAVPNDQVISLLGRFNVVAVPSPGLETGPLVVLEAFAARVPVVGSNIGGIAELVEDGVNGLLVEPGSVSAWQTALEQLARDTSLRRALRARIRPPRTMSDVAAEMLALYTGLVR